MIILALPILTFAQSGPPAPSAGIWALIDTNYTVGTSTVGISQAKITLKIQRLLYILVFNSEYFTTKMLSHQHQLLC